MLMHVRVAGVVCVMAGVAQAASAQTRLLSGFRETVVVQNLQGPTGLAFLPDGRVLVTEKRGTLRLVRDGKPLGAPILTIPVSTEKERGLGGVVADPLFANNGFIYVYYATSPASCPGPTCDPASRSAAASRPFIGPRNRVSRFTLSGDAIDPNSEIVILDGIPSDSGEHNAGNLAFGPDGKLYVSVGDGGETPEHAQDVTLLSGKMLRLNADGSVPADNPYYLVPSARSEIWALGFRNPWRFTFDEEGHLYVGDVGEDLWEEIDEVVKGADYGWPYFEGPDLTSRGIDALGEDGGNAALITIGAPSTPPSTLRPPRRSRVAQSHYMSPLFPYSHEGNGAAIILGAVPGSKSQYPEALRQRLFFADLVWQRVWSLAYDREVGTMAAEPFADGVGNTSQLLGGPDGNVWFVSFSRGVLARFEVAPVR